MSNESQYREAVLRAKAEGRTVDIGKVVAQMKRKPLDYAGIDLGSHTLNVFVGEHEGVIRIDDSISVPVGVSVAQRIIARLRGD